TLLGFVAVTCSSTNAFGGFLITDRMLRMFKTAEERARGTRRPVELQAFALVAAVVAAVAGILYTTRPAGMAMGEYLHEHVAAEALRYCYILSAGGFVLGLKGRASPLWARAADHVPGPERPQPRSALGHRGLRGLSGGHPGSDRVLLRDGGAGAGLRPPARHPDRRGGHAGGDCAAQLVRRPRRCRDGLRA